MAGFVSIARSAHAADIEPGAPAWSSGLSIGAALIGGLLIGGAVGHFLGRRVERRHADGETGRTLTATAGGTSSALATATDTIGARSGTDVPEAGHPSSCEAIHTAGIVARLGNAPASSASFAGARAVSVRPDGTTADGARPTTKLPASLNGLAAESYREVVDSLSEVLFRTDELGRLVFLNDAWKDLSGFGLDSTRLHSLTDFLHPDDRLRARDAIRALLAGDGQEWTDELRLRTLAGEIRWVGIACRALRDGSGQETGIAGTIDDISARKIAEFSLRNLNQELESRVRSRTAELETAMRELEAFSYSVSHDLRAPLRAIDGFARILAEEAGPGLEERHREQLVRIRAGAERMAILIDALIDLASVSRQPLRRQSVDLSRIAEAVIRDLQAESPGRAVAVEITRDMTVVADPVLMHVLLDNLLRNAWKFTSHCEHPHIVFGAAREGERTVFHVEDNGAGFDMNYAGKLFQPFQRLHAQHEFPGTGIGLATVQRIVARHEGRVWASAEPGKGARFCFMLWH